MKKFCCWMNAKANMNVDWIGVDDELMCRKYMS